MCLDFTTFQIHIQIKLVLILKNSIIFIVHYKNHQGEKIMKKIILPSIAALLVSVSGANAMELRPFVGATMGLQGMFYSHDAKHQERALQYDLPTSLFTFGVEGGFRFGEYSKIYNGGVSVNLDMSTETDIDHKFNDAKVAELHTNVISATYDNYIRISGDKTSRIDLVLGAGLGSMSYDVDNSVLVGLSNGTHHSAVAVIKAGLDFELTKNFTLSATTRWFIPTKSDYDVNSTYIVGGAVKYVF